MMLTGTLDVPIVVTWICFGKPTAAKDKDTDALVVNTHPIGKQ